jgi:hypothetical protein
VFSTKLADTSGNPVRGKLPWRENFYVNRSKSMFATQAKYSSSFVALSGPSPSADVFGGRNDISTKCIGPVTLRRCG